MFTLIRIPHPTQPIGGSEKGVAIGFHSLLI